MLVDATNKENQVFPRHELNHSYAMLVLAFFSFLSSPDHLRISEVAAFPTYCDFHWDRPRLADKVANPILPYYMSFFFFLISFL